jgi:hypothetical protein
MLAPQSEGGAMPTMLILRGKAGFYDGKNWPRGALDEPPALEYARRRGYAGKVLDVAGVAEAGSEQVKLALAEFRRDQSVTALYGFSAGGYNVKHILDALTPVERQRLRLVIVLGAPNPPGRDYQAELKPTNYGATYELIYRLNPPEGHMAGPRALLATLRP